MKGKRTPSRREDGQILAIFAGALVLLILISGLVIDGGNVFVTRRDSQDSADIGSMAGTKRLADYYVKSQTFTSTNNVYTAIATRMDQNNCSSAAGSICSWTARYVGPRTGSSFQDLGPVSSTDTAPPGAAERPEGPRRQGQRHEDAADVPSRCHRSVDLDGQLDRHVGDRSADRRAGGPAVADRHGRSDDHERGLDLRIDQRLERAGQLRLDLMGWQQRRRIAGDEPLHA